MSTVGTRIGMVLAFAGVGLLLSSPVAGVVLGNGGGWRGLQLWSGAMIFASTSCMLAARIAKAGVKMHRV